MTEHPLYILRHGQTVWNAEDRMQGWGDSPLTERGEMDAARQYEILRGRDLTGFTGFTSPLGRAVATARIAVAPLVRQLVEDIRLREIGAGMWQGRLPHEREGYVPGGDVLAQYRNAPGGEGLTALTARCEAFLADLTGPAIIVTHGITSRVLRGLIVGADAMHEPTPNGGQGAVWHVTEGRQHLLR